MADRNDLDARASALANVAKALKQPRVGIRLDILARIMADLDSDKELQGMFGSPVTAKLGIIAAVNDLRIVEIEAVKLSDAQKKRFLEVLNAILTRRIVEPETL